MLTISRTCFKMALDLASKSGVSNSSKSISTITVIGAGLMGSGIAQVSAQSGYNVTLVDLNKELLDKSMGNLKQSLLRVGKKQYKDQPEELARFVDRTMAQISTGTNAAESAAGSDLIIEAVVENIPLKHKLFKELSKTAPKHCIFASNTSSLSIADLAAAVPERVAYFGGLHFFNPVPMMKLVEVVRTKETSDLTFDQLMKFGKSLGKVAIPCKDTPGFIVNRLLVPYMMEATRMVERGDAQPHDIDTAMKLGAGYPMGPLELGDYVGLDTCKFIIDGWHTKYPENPLFAPSKLLDSMIAENRLGRKVGRGYYEYDDKGNKK